MTFLLYQRKDSSGYIGNKPAGKLFTLIYFHYAKNVAVRCSPKMNYENILAFDRCNIRFLFITANTGSIFEKPDLSNIWINEFAKLIRTHPSDFIALHCQEVGGKDYEQFMPALDPFLQELLNLPEIKSEFTRHRLYFDSDYESQKTFTALGCAYFIRQNLPVEQWNFATSTFQAVVNRQIFAGNLVNAQTLKKEKYPREFFPETKWSRKGFTQTRWLINGLVFDLLNIHLFHDASNILAAEQSPSLYSKCRQRALKHTLESLSLDENGQRVPLVIFGDFNFRLDAHRLVQHMADQQNHFIQKIKEENSDEIGKIIIRKNNQPKLTIEKKGFDLHDEHEEFFNVNTQQARLFDVELMSFNDQLFEYERTFPPSYPYSEELDEANSYLRARCPAWCDRILLSHSFRSLACTEDSAPLYNIVGRDVCVGDHKPVYLSITVHPVQVSKEYQQPTTSNSNKISIENSFDHSSESNFNSSCNELVSVAIAIDEKNTDNNRLLKQQFFAKTSLDDDHRTVLARHRFSSSIKHTSTRWFRETPV